MKTEKAQIRLILRTNKTLSDGTHPIMLRVNWNKERKEKATGFSCKIAAWSTTEECLRLRGRDALPNAPAINTHIIALKQQADNICNEFVAKGQPYSASMIIERLNDDRYTQTSDLAGLAEEYIQTNHLKIESAICIRGAVKMFLQYMNLHSLQMSEVTKGHATGFGRWCAKKGLKNSTIRNRIQRMRTLFRYAEENDRVATNPFKAVKESKLYKSDNQKQALTKEAYILLNDYYYRKILQFLENHSEEELNKRYFIISSRLFALNTFLMSFEMQGLSLIDMAKLNISNFETSRMSDSANSYFVINTQRSKTLHAVPIVIKMDSRNLFLLFKPYILQMTENYYLLPIIRKSDDTDKKILSRMRYATTAINYNLKKIWDDYNDWVDYLINNYDNLSKIDKAMVQHLNLTYQNRSKFKIDSKTTLYAARHTFATIYINSEGAKSSELAQMMGRSVAGMDRYIRDLMTIDDVVSAKEKMMK